MITFGLQAELQGRGKDSPTVKLPNMYAAASLHLMGFEQPQSEGRIHLTILPRLSGNILLLRNSKKNKPNTTPHKLEGIMAALEQLHVLFVEAYLAGEDIYWG